MAVHALAPAPPAVRLLPHPTRAAAPARRSRRPSRRALAVCSLLTAALCAMWTMWTMCAIVVDRPRISERAPVGASALFLSSAAALCAAPAVLLIFLGAHD